MSPPFPGFHVSYAIDQRHPTNPARPAFIVCKECGTEGIRQAGYMQKECTEITCKKCGNHSVKNGGERK